MDAIALRHQFHRIAERSGVEFETRALIFRELEALSPTKILASKVGNHLLAEFFFSVDGPTVLLRADFDAVGIDETPQGDYYSIHKGFSHKCGHDGHTVILLEVARELKKNPFSKGRVLLLFQGAEETGVGAQQILDQHLLDEYSIDYVFALHNIPGEPLGTILCGKGSFSCSVVSCEIKLEGETSHAAEPQKAVSSLNAAIQITQTLLEDNCFDFQSPDCKVTTLVEMHIGSPNYGVTAGSGVVRLTIRARTDERLKKEQIRIENTVKQIVAKTPKLQYKIDWYEYFAANENDSEAVDIVFNAAKMCDFPTIEIQEPFRWGEDFGLFTQSYHGAMFGIGAGLDCAPLHHSNYDFSDALLEKGRDIFVHIIGAILGFDRKKNSNK